MVKKLQKLSTDKKKAGSLLSDAVKDSAQQIWLAGLGAFSRAQEEGSKVFESLVKDGMAVQRKTQSAAEEKISEATSRMTSMASDIGARAAGQWDKLESIFEDRVAKAMATLGVPSAHDLQALTARLEALEKILQPAPVTARTRAKAAEKTAANGSAEPADRPAPKAARKATARKDGVSAAAQAASPTTPRAAPKSAVKKAAAKPRTARAASAAHADGAAGAAENDSARAA